MSRRDTIIVAILVNAGLLLVLFATAVRTDKKEPQNPTMQLAQVQEASVADPLPLKEEVELVFSPVQEEVIVQAPVVKEEAPFVHVTVKKGDFLEKIASANNTTVNALLKANQLASTQLKIGQVLKVPLNAQAPPEAPAIAEEEYYVVQDGDNPWLIAARNHVKLHELLRLNGLDEQKARRLRPGDRLRIR